VAAGGVVLVAGSVVLPVVPVSPVVPVPVPVVPVVPEVPVVPVPGGVAAGGVAVAGVVAVSAGVTVVVSVRLQAPSMVLNSAAVSRIVGACESAFIGYSSFASLSAARVHKLLDKRRRGFSPALEPDARSDCEKLDWHSQRRFVDFWKTQKNPRPRPRNLTKIKPGTDQLS
jgi:hypothetical protein